MIGALTTALILEGTRICSDGSRPIDRLGERPVTLKLDADGRFALTVSAPGVHDPKQTCRTIQRGAYAFDGDNLTTAIDQTEQCGDCPPVLPVESPQTSTARMTMRADEFRLHLNETFGEGGSCRPGQSLNIELRPIKEPPEPIACEATPSS